MKEDITADRIANDIRMTRTQYFGSFLIIEGNDDKEVYKWFVDNDTCQIVIALGKENATAVLTILEQDGFLGVLAIVDADFDILEGKLPSTQNLLLTDTHDLETMMIRSPALDKVLSEFGSTVKITDFTRRHGKDIRTALVECGIPIGYLLWVSLRESLSLRFDEMDCSKFINKDTLTIDVPKLIRIVNSRTDATKKGKLRRLADSDIQKSMEQLKDDTHDPWHVCCGHDLVCTLSVGLRTILGTNNANDVKPIVLERDLRLAFEQYHFHQTQLYVSIQMWEKANQPFVVLKATP